MIAQIMIKDVFAEKSDAVEKGQNQIETFAEIIEKTL